MCSSRVIYGGSDLEIELVLSVSAADVLPAVSFVAERIRVGPPTRSPPSRLRSGRHSHARSKSSATEYRVGLVSWKGVRSMCCVPGVFFCTFGPGRRSGLWTLGLHPIEPRCPSFRPRSCLFSPASPDRAPPAWRETSNQISASDPASTPKQGGDA
jgi:hypothetical protein